jgi:hypothetical protein
MAATYEPIASQTLGSDTATVTFSGIPSTYTDLVLVADTKRTVAGTGGTDLNVRVGNGTADTGSNYSSTYLQGNGSSAGSGRQSSQSSFGYTGSAQTSAASTGISVLHFMSYANTNVYKTVLVSVAVPVEFARRVVNLWRSTSAIDIIEIYGASGSIKAGSVLSLYGIKAA